MKSTADKRKEMLRVSRQSDKMDFHNYGSVKETLAGAKTPLPDSPAKPPSKKGKADDDSSSVISMLSNLINTRSDTIEKMVASDRERRQLLWPAVDKARKEGKRAHFVGGRAFVDGSEIHPP
ncbi:hypothetical protein DPX16_22298 [Anabarilius grahami]|uniref:Uncharacterized protein n=1 Tax=Anabarilius grahami TaxID=495550 RepID=A0A3N0Y044_ANAGA|nr:hypothetical protein DPX16_22298 [Anabarilius grahami]